MLFRCLLILVSLAALSLGCSDEPPYFIPGSATLPSCTEAPAFDLDGTVWSDSGIVMIETAGCDGAQPGQDFFACALDWAMTQTDSDVEIIVDSEYRILGRLCGAELHLEGGWWLPVQDAGMCTYEEDSAAEVGIQTQGSTLTIVDGGAGQFLVGTGILAVRGPCEATYDITLNQIR